MDIVYEVLPIWEFDMVSIDNNVGPFSRLGMEDRNIVGVMGSLILFLIGYLMTQALYLLLVKFKEFSFRVRRVLRYISHEAAFRTVFILFFLETYLDLTLGGLLNTENDYLLVDPANWGPRGLLNTSD